LDYLFHYYSLSVFNRKVNVFTLQRYTAGRKKSVAFTGKYSIF